MQELTQGARSTAGRAVTTILLAAAAACSSGPAKPKVVGDAPELGAQLAFTDTATPPARVTVQLAQASSAVLVYVVPGQGASLVYPADSLHSARLSEGTHVVEPKYPAVRDPRAMMDSLRRQRDSIGTRRDPRAGRTVTPGAPGTTVQISVPDGFLMLVATRASLDPAVVASRLQGVTIPGDPDEALNAIGKLVRSTAAIVAPWSGYALPLRLQPTTTTNRRPGGAARSGGRRVDVLAP